MQKKKAELRFVSIAMDVKEARMSRSSLFEHSLMKKFQKQNEL